MTAGGGHAHGHALTATGRHRGRLAAVMAITLSIAAGEIAGGILSGALVLLADAAHMAADAAGVGLSLLAAHFASKPATLRRTFGYARAEILAATVNALLLLGMATFIVVEAVQRLTAPPPVSTGVMVVFGCIALAGNGASLILLHQAQAESMNARGAFLEVASDMFGALAVLITAAIIAVSGFTLADPIASLLVGALIVPRTWRLLR
ncbi:MAG TPA: cation diffusion facilitator family transporter, partial [Streptosporangiaceae bacterium]